MSAVSTPFTPNAFSPAGTFPSLLTPVNTVPPPAPKKGGSWVWPLLIAFAAIVLLWFIAGSVKSSTGGGGSTGGDGGGSTGGGGGGSTGGGGGSTGVDGSWPNGTVLNYSKGQLATTCNGVKYYLVPLRYVVPIGQAGAGIVYQFLNLIRADNYSPPSAWEVRYGTSGSVAFCLQPNGNTLNSNGNCGFIESAGLYLGSNGCTAPTAAAGMPVILQNDLVLLEQPDAKSGLWVIENSTSNLAQPFTLRTLDSTCYNISTANAILTLDDGAHVRGPYLTSCLNYKDQFGIVQRTFLTNSGSTWTFEPVKPSTTNIQCDVYSNVLPQ